MVPAIEDPHKRNFVRVRIRGPSMDRRMWHIQPQSQQIEDAIFGMHAAALRSKYGNTLYWFKSNVLAGHMSRLMNGLSQSTEARSSNVS